MAVVFCSCAATTESSRPSDSQGLASEPTAMGSFQHEEPTTVAEAGPPTTAAPPAPRTCEMFARPGVLKRAALVGLLDAGLPRWLQGVEGDRALAKHRFQGWLVKSLYPDDPCYKEVDLRPGDVVQKVNGKSIEKPEQAFDVAESLRTAPALVVEYLRDGKATRLSIAITDENTEPGKRTP
jgi:hypothetical protein